MKRTLLCSGLALAFVGIVHADYDPIPLTPASFTADVVVENTVPHPLKSFITASMDAGTNTAGGATWYEQGFNTNMPSTGLPPAGTDINPDGTHQFRMPASYATDNAVYLKSDQVASGSLSLTTPTALTGLSIMCSAGGGAVTLDYTIHFQGGATETGQFVCGDWYNNSPVAWTANGRIQIESAEFNNVYGNNPRLNYVDLPIYGTEAIASIDFAALNGGGRACIMGLSGETTLGGGFSPLNVTGFNYDMVVEAAASHIYGSLFGATTATMDGGTNNTSRTWYEQGLNTGTPTSGLPPAGTTFAAVGDANHSFTMPPSYVGNNAVFIASTDPDGTLTLSTPTALSGLSFLSSCGGGAVPINYTVHFQDSSTEIGTFTSPDWFNTTDASTGWISDGRFNTDNANLENVGASPKVPRLHFNDIALTNTASPVTSIDFSYGGSGGRCSLFAVSGQASGGGSFSPLAVTGFNRDMVVENISPTFLHTQPERLTTATTVSMDGGTNNTGNTWYEQGYFPQFPNSGLPEAGSTFTSRTLSDHHYQMPASYMANNCMFVDAAHPVANITPATPAWYSGLSFLSATAHGRVTNECIMQYSDGTTETNQFVSLDWFNNDPYAFSTLGRVNLGNQTINNDPTRTTTPNPRLYEAQFALSAPQSVMLTNILLTFIGSQNPDGLMAVLAVSGTTGPVAPIIRNQLADLKVFEGSNAVISVTMGGGTPPISYQWQVDKGAGFVDVADDAIISGANSTALSFMGITYANQGSYRFIASGPSLSSTSTVAFVQVLLPLPDVTQPTDPLAIYQPNGGDVPPAAEDVDKVLDNTTSKYLNRGSGTTPFSGPAGFIVTPSVGGTIVSAVRFYTANDTEGRDPADFTLEGSNDGGVNYAVIATGALALPSGRNGGGAALNPLTQALQEVRLANTAGYTSYRLSIATVKGNESLMQVGEVELLGIVDPSAVPTVLVAPQDTTVNEGTTATFSVTAVGPGQLGYKWFDVTSGDPGTPVGVNAATLALANVTAAMNGRTYRVVVTNQFGGTASPAMTLPGAQLTVVSGPPTITEDLVTESLVYAGRTTVLPVTLVGTEPFTLQWQKDGGDLSDTDRILGSQSNVLSITDSAVADSGSYQLVITNIHGAAQSAMQVLTVQKVAAFTPNGAGWAFNGTPLAPVIQSGVLNLTYGAGGTAASAWYPDQLYIRDFKASFVYQDVNTGGADGTAFVLHNDPRGTAALGGGGAGLGYSGITPSVALQLNIYNSSGIAFNTNGATGGYSATTPVDLANGNPIKVDITCVAGVAHVTLTDTVTSDTFAADLPVGSLPDRLGADTAYVGFTGADGGTVSVQNVSEFSFIPLPTLSAQIVGGSLVLSWPASVGGFGVESKAGLTSGTWTPVAAPVNLVDDHYEVTVSLDGDQYFRLALQ